MISFRKLLLLPVALLSLSPAADAAPTTAPVQMKDHFPIGVWFDGRVEGINCPEGFHNVPNGLDAARAYYEKNFTDIRDHNLDIVVIPNTPPDYRETLLAAADKVGVKIVLELVELAYPDFGQRYSVRHGDMIQDEVEVRRYIEKLIAPLRVHPSLFAYQVLDEPTAEQFPNFSRVSRALSDLDPQHPSFSCLCIEGELHRTAAMEMQMVIFDRYPLQKGMVPGEHKFTEFRALLDSLDHHAGAKPYWMVVQSCAMDRPTGLRYPTAAELRLMTWMSLAHNAKGLFFFIHNSYTQQEKLQGLVDLEMKPHPIYAEVSALSLQMKSLAPHLLSMERTTATLLTARDGFDIQSFSGRDGAKYAAVVNNDVLNAKTYEGSVAGDAAGEGAGAAPAEVAAVLESQTGIMEKSDTPGQVRLKLQPGEGCFLRIGARARGAAGGE